MNFKEKLIYNSRQMSGINPDFENDISILIMQKPDITRDDLAQCLFKTSFYMLRLHKKMLIIKIEKIVLESDEYKKRNQHNEIKKP